MCTDWESEGGRGPAESLGGGREIGLGSHTHNQRKRGRVENGGVGGGTPTHFYIRLTHEC